MIHVNTYGNRLGDARAENDNVMLESAFVETSDFHALTKTSDFNFIVGRRGTGKSALFLKTYEYFYNEKSFRVLKIIPEEYETIALADCLQKLTDDYGKARSITKLAWHLSLLIEVADDLCRYYKTRNHKESSFLFEYLAKHESLKKQSAVLRVLRIIQSVQQDSSIGEIPCKIAMNFDFKRLKDTVCNTLEVIKKRSVVLVDKLDEGWVPESIPAAVVGGLTLAASSISESCKHIHIYAYIRDNIFRVLSVLDKDFSRDIESSTLRLQWDSENLFNLTTLRIAKSYGLLSENSRKIWNRFAHRGLEERAGFEKCLKYTLFRPRDIIALLNLALNQTMRGNRAQIIEDDIESAAKEISKGRLQDLIKEYDQVLPSLELLILCYQSHAAVFNFDQAIQNAQNFLDSVRYQNQAESDFAIFNTPQDVFKSLYSVGFIGISTSQSQGFQFSFDGAPALLDEIKSDTRICIHPCYWPSLAISSDSIDIENKIRIHDDYTAKENPELASNRAKKIGQLISELPAMPTGLNGANDFEKWCLRAVQMLFSGQLANAELHPNSNATQRRDIVATNIAEKGFWKNLKDTYQCQEVVFEVKNFEKLNLDNYRQAVTYADDQIYGKFIFLITRGGEGLEKVERSWLQEMYYKKDVIIFTLPATILSAGISKLRSKKRFDYIESTLIKRLGTYRRNYLSLKS